MSFKPKPINAEGELEKNMTTKGILGQMARGSLVAASIILVPVIFIYVIYLVGLLLPPESKQADDPTPDSFSHYEMKMPGLVDHGVSTDWA